MNVPVHLVAFVYISFDRFKSVLSIRVQFPSIRLAERVLIVYALNCKEKQWDEAGARESAIQQSLSK